MKTSSRFNNSNTNTAAGEASSILPKSSIKGATLQPAELGSAGVLDEKFVKTAQTAWNKQRPSGGAGVPDSNSLSKEYTAVGLKERKSVVSDFRGARAPEKGGPDGISSEDQL